LTKTGFLISAFLSKAGFSFSTVFPFIIVGIFVGHPYSHEPFPKLLLGGSKMARSTKKFTWFSLVPKQNFALNSFSKELY
jgi:hypothetical protein